MPSLEHLPSALFLAATASSTSDLRIALVGAIAAIAGSIVGGSITGVVSLRAERKRQEFTRSEERARWDREDDREKMLALAAARAVRSQYLRAYILLDHSLTPPVGWYRMQDIAVPAIDTDDRKLLARFLTPIDWAAIELADLGLETVLASYHDAKKKAGESEPELSSVDARNVRSAGDFLRSAIRALDTLGETSDLTQNIEQVLAEYRAPAANREDVPKADADDHG